MTNEKLMMQLRAANPARGGRLDNDQLYRQIVAGPADERLSVTAPKPRRRFSRTFGLMAILAVGGSTAYAAGVFSPLTYFENNVNASPNSPWSEQVDPGTVKPVASATIPGIGRVQYWHGATHGGGLCWALKLPDGSFAGARDSRAENDRGGSMPGCFKTRAQVNEGGDPVYVLTGFDYNESVLAMPKSDPAWRGRLSVWRVYYGVLDANLKAVRITDPVTKITVPVRRGRYFVFPFRDVTGNYNPMPQMRAYNAAGKVVAQD